MANLSERHFSRLFKESTGVSPHQYVIRQRVEKARDLLASTDLPVGEVALVCGFAHQGHLARHFGRLVGVTPAPLPQRVASLERDNCLVLRPYCRRR